MNKINVLSKEISELIAAGEVIERPCSVIKELIENSIDSGADIITVEIKDGGISYIRITDNGCGISYEDVPLAFLRHATSKIVSKYDLDSIMTLGFRGEALASIAAISKVDMLSKRIEDEYGTHYKIEGSIEKCIEKSGCPDGTTIVIRDIFYNVPARLKFLKKPVTEGNSVASVIKKLALSHPEVSFKFIRDNKQELLTPGDGKMYSAIFSVFGKEFAKSLLPVDYEYENIKVTGFTVKPVLSRSNRSFQHFFINNRYVKSVTCTVSLEEAYKNSIMTGKFPACVLNIEVPPEIVDVNVHPAKIEVRFSDEKLIFDSLYFAIKNALLKNDTLNEFKIKESVDYTIKQNSFIVENEPPVQLEMNNSSFAFQSKEEEYICPSVNNNSIKENKILANHQDIVLNSVKNDNNDSNSLSDTFKYIDNRSFIKKPEQTSQNTDVSEEKSDDVNIRIIGEVFLTYILAEIKDELILIDKHAAHERIIFEKILSNEEMLHTQTLLTPIKVLLSCEEFDAFVSSKDTINSLGFSFHPCGDTEIEITGIPSVIDNTDVDSLIIELADNLLLKKRNPNLEIINDLYHSIACKSAIKAHDKSDITELNVLVKRIYNDEKLRYCPHGRPVMIKLTKKEIEKQFKRII